MVEPARRVRALPTYVFLELRRACDAARASGVDVIDLTVGTPRAEVPRTAIETLRATIDDPDVHGYPPFRGCDELRTEIARWYQRRFAVEIDPETELLPVLGSKEGLYHLMQAYLDPDDVILVPTPCYPAYLSAARLCEARIVELPLSEERDFLLDFAAIDRDAARAAKMLVLNYPHNPTGAVADLDHYRDAVAFAVEHDLLLVSDIPYSELVLDEGIDPPSMLQLPGAKSVCVELQSLSKSHSMAGWRFGFAVGNATALAALAKVKSAADFGAFLPVQKAAAAALREGDATVARAREIYRARRDTVCDGLAAAGWPVRRPRAGMYVWTRLPEGFGGTDTEFVETLFERSGVLLTPGSAFGSAGCGWVRLSLVEDPPRLRDAVARIAKSGLIA